MSTINYNDFNDLFMSYDEREDNRKKYILEQIKLRQKRLAETQMEIDSRLYLKALIEKDLVSAIQTDINNEYKFNMFAGLKSDILWKTWRWFWHKDEDKLNKAEEDDFENSYNYVISVINRRLLSEDENYKLVEIYDYNYGKFYDFVYDYKGIKLQISIPVFDRAGVDDFNQYLSGYTISEKVNDCCWEAVVHGLDYEEVASQLKEWIKKRVKENNKAKKQSEEK